MAIRSEISKMTADAVQEEINGLTKNEAAKHFGFATSGSLGNALDRYFKGTVFTFASAKNGGSSNGKANPVAIPTGRFNSSLVGLWAGLRAGFPSYQMPELIDPAIISAWFQGNKDHAAIIAAAIDASDWNDVRNFCERTGIKTPRFVAWENEENKKQIAGLVASVASIEKQGHFVIGQYGSAIGFSNASASVADTLKAIGDMVKKAAEELDVAQKKAKKAVGTKSEAEAKTCLETALESMMKATDNAVGPITTAKNDVERIERDYATLVAFARKTILSARAAKDYAKQAVIACEETMQPIIAKLANLKPKQPDQDKPEFTPEQSALIASAMALGMSNEEAVSFLKAKGKL